MRLTLGRISLTLSWSLFSFTLSRALIVPNVADILTLGIDYIVVGGGTAGNVIANRLTEDPKVRVLVLEAGPSDHGVLDSEVPFFCNLLSPGTPYDWNYTTTPQVGLGGRSIPYPRGHILGGSSSINYLIYTRGSSDDFDRYAAVSGDPGWSWNAILPYFLKNEKWTPPVDNHNTTGQFNPSVHGFTGINSVSLAGNPTAIDGRVITATQQLGGDFSFNLDVNSGTPLGVGWVQATVNRSRRSSSSTSYLASNFLERPNLYVVVKAQVSRLIQTGVQNGVPVFQGVEFRIAGFTLRLAALKEVILSAGTVNTPQILLNSGIGDSKALSSLGITPLVNLPSVGQNLSDHAFLGNPWLTTGNNTFEVINRDPNARAQALQQWQTNGTGPLVDTLVDHLGFLRIPSGDPLFQNTPDPAAGPNTPHYELLVANGLPLGLPGGNGLLVPADPPAGFFIAIGTVVLQPTSRGSVTLASSNPFAAPVIDAGLLKTDFDKGVMREAVKSAFKFLSAPVWSDYVVTPVGPLANATDDALLDTYIAQNSQTLFHPTGTASMSPKGAQYGVVDPDLRVKNVVGLRIVDASVLPFVPSAHTQATVYAFAERAADLIKAAL